MKKTRGIAVVIAIGLFIFGFISLMRGCLAKHDTHKQIDEAQYFHSQQIDIVVYIKEFFNCTSYSSGHGMTHISGSTSYFLETRDAVTLELIKQTPFKDFDDYAKKRPSIIGNDGTLIWVYQDGVMAFNPLTHQIVCDNEKLEQVNAELRNNLPKEKKYFTFNYNTRQLEVKAKNAISYRIDTKTFKASKIEEGSDETPEIIALQNLKNVVKMQVKGMKTTNYDQDRVRWKLEDSVRNIESRIRKMEDEVKDNIKKLKDRQEAYEKGFNSYHQQLNSSLRIDNQIIALLSAKELKESQENFYMRNISYEEEQRALYQTLITDNSSNSYYKVSQWRPLNPQTTFLKAGFLMSKGESKVIELQNPTSCLVISSKEVGDKSKLILHRLGFDGKIIWTKELPIIDFYDMIFTGKNLILFANDGVKVTGNDDCNWLISIDLNTGNFILLDLGNEKKK